MTQYLEKWIAGNPKMAVVLGGVVGSYGAPYLKEAAAFVGRLLSLGGG